MIDENGNLYRGFIATILDVCMGMGFWEPLNRGLFITGVTVDMSFTFVILLFSMKFHCFRFIDTAKLGETIIIKCETIKADETRGFFKGEVLRKLDNVLIATGKQTLSFKAKSRI